MASHLSEMENEGIIVIGRPVTTEFESTEQIEKVAAAVDEFGRKNSLRLGLVYCGTTINWPDEFEYTPSVIGIVTHVHWGDEEESASPVPASAFQPMHIPDELWTMLKDEHGIEVKGDNGTYLCVAGWTWTEINDANGERIVGVSAEDDGYRRIDDNDRIMKGEEALQMRASYC